MDTPSSLDYIGTELEVFKHAENWKRYWGGKLAPHIRGRVGEVGAGIGGSTPQLFSVNATSWTLIEPDANMGAGLQRQAPSCLHSLPTRVEISTLAGLPEDQRFDTLTYIDVLEHIEDDAAEVAEAFRRLDSGGIIAALSPANMALFSDFDRAVGHFRRYTLPGFQALFETEGVILASGCLDFPGTALSLANRLMLRQSSPRQSQIAFWDRWIVPCARWIDPLIGHRLGRSVYVIAQKR